MTFDPTNELHSGQGFFRTSTKLVDICKNEFYIFVHFISQAGRPRVSLVRSQTKMFFKIKISYSVRNEITFWKFLNKVKFQK